MTGDSRRFHRFLFSLFFIPALVCAGPNETSTNDLLNAVRTGSYQPTPAELSGIIEKQIAEVPEFRFMRETAQSLGIRIWLFGGTAAAFGHYAKWDEMRKRGDKRFQAERFDYDYTNIFRSTQDLDIVVDGTPEQANRFRALLQEKFNYFQGNKEAWEVRLLRKTMGAKEALLGNPSFLNQHTDSNSTGMIELTIPAKGESVVRDLRDWNSPTPHFLKDVAEGKLHYYFSEKHAETERAKNGNNPPILSVIRYLTKAFQYDLELRPEDLEKIREIINGISASPLQNENEYVRDWIERNAKKLIQHAVNIEYALKTLDELGLRKTLTNLKGDVSRQDSLAWWLSKEPLATKAVGTGQGNTARQLGIETVAHETNNFLAYESITRSHTGEPNALISRDGRSGEAAVYGNGFYTRIGRTGARGTKITIRFKVDPNAREGTDFTRHGDYIIFLNKAALRVIPESLVLSPVEYFDFLLHGETIDSNEKALLEKFRRRLHGRLATMTAIERTEISRKIVEGTLRQFPGSETAINEWFALPPSEHQYLVDEIKTQTPANQAQLIRATANIRHQSQALRELWRKSQSESNELIRSAALSAILRGGTQQGVPKEDLIAILKKLPPKDLDLYPKQIFDDAYDVRNFSSTTSDEILLKSLSTDDPWTTQHSLVELLKRKARSPELEERLEWVLKNNHQDSQELVELVLLQKSPSLVMVEGLLDLMYRSSNIRNAAKGAIQKLLAHKSIPREFLSHAIANKNKHTLVSAIEFLNLDISHDRELMLRELRTGSDEARLAVARRLQEELVRLKDTVHQKTFSSFVNPLASLAIHSGSNDLRTSAYYALGLFEIEDAENLRAHLAISGDKNVETSASLQATKRVQKHLTTHPKRIDHLREALAEINDSIMYGALAHLDPDAHASAIAKSLGLGNSDLLINVYSHLIKKGKIPTDVESIMISTKADHPWRVRQLEAQLLSLSKQTSWESIDKLIMFLEDHDNDVRQTAKQSFVARFPTKEERASILLEATQKNISRVGLALEYLDPKNPNHYPVYVAGFSSDDSTTQLAAYTALQKAGRFGPDLVPHLLKWLNSGGWKSRQLAVKAMGEIRPVSKEAQRGIFRALTDSDSDVRNSATAAYAKIKPLISQASVFHESIIENATGAEVVKLLPEMDLSNPKMRNAVIQVVKGDNISDTLNALEQLQKLKVHSFIDIEDAILSQTNYPDWRVRHKAITALEASGSKRREVFSAFFSAEVDSDSDVRHAGSSAIKNMPLTKVERDIFLSQLSENPTVPIAINLFNYLDFQHSKNSHILIKVLREGDSSQIISALKFIQKQKLSDPEITREVARTCQHAEWNTRLQGVITLNEMANRTPEKTEALFFAMADGDSDVVHAAKAGWRKLAVTDLEMSPLLDKVRKGGTPNGYKHLLGPDFHGKPFEKEFLVRALSEKSDLTVTMVAMANIVSRNLTDPDFVKPINVHYSTWNWEHRMKAAEVIGVVKPRDLDSFKTLLLLSKDQDSDVSRVAFRSLRSVAYTTSEIQTYMKQLAPNHPPGFWSFIRTNFPDIDLTSVADTVRTVLLGNDSELCLTLISLLSQQGSRSKPFVTALHELMGSNSENLRREVARALGKIDAGDEKSVHLLLRALTDSDADVAKAAKQSLVAMQENHSVVISHEASHLLPKLGARFIGEALPFLRLENFDERASLLSVMHEVPDNTKATIIKRFQKGRPLNLAESQTLSVHLTSNDNRVRLATVGVLRNVSPELLDASLTAISKARADEKTWWGKLRTWWVERGIKRDIRKEQRKPATANDCRTAHDKLSGNSGTRVR